MEKERRKGKLMAEIKKRNKKLRSSAELVGSVNFSRKYIGYLYEAFWTTLPDMYWRAESLFILAVREAFGDARPVKEVVQNKDIRAPNGNNISAGCSS